MKNYIKRLSLFLMAASLFTACQKDDYSLGELKAPTNLVINTEIVGKDAAHPNGDGSGIVKITATADNVISYKVGYNNITDLSGAIEFSALGGGVTNKKFTTTGLNTYRITVIAYGKGGVSTTAATEVTVQSDFTPEEYIVTNLTNNASKTWVVDKEVAGHFGVGPWSNEVTPIWWSAGVREKEACCPCFYTSTFTFTKTADSYSITSTTPDGAFTKTGALAAIPGIPGAGDEGCYSYGGGSAAFSFIPASSGIDESAPSTQTSIMLTGNTTFIGYGSLQKEYEIMVITADYMYLRVQGFAAENGNAWYIKLKPAP